MLIDIILIIGGIVLVLWGADRMTDGAVSIAKRMKISEIVIGLTIVAMGTSMPELCISLVSAFKGSSDLAVGNVVGSNIMNTLLIVGVTAAIAPMAILRSTVNKDIPWVLVASVMLIFLCFNNTISRIDAMLLVLAFAIFMYFTLKNAHDDQSESSQEAEGKKPMSPQMATGMVLLGLACLILGSNLFVDAASRVAQSLGVSEAVIGLTIVAGGTSLPELATCVVAARKGQSGIAIGNVIGSNVFNILLILGATGLVCPMTINGITPIDYGMMALSVFVLWLFCFTKYEVERWEGALLTALYAIYLGWLLWNAV